MGSCVCKSYLPIVKIEEIIDIPSLYESPMKLGTCVGEPITKRKLCIKVKSSRNDTVIQSKPFLTFISTETYNHNKFNSNQIYSSSDNSNSTIANNQEAQGNKNHLAVEYDEDVKNIDNPCSLKEFNEEEEKVLIKILEKHYLFQDFTEEDIAKVIEEITVYQYDSNLNLFSKGETADRFYILKSGQIELSNNGNNNIRIKPKESFGEIALIGDQSNYSRTYQATSLVETELYGLDGKVYQNLLNTNEAIEEEKEKINTLLQKSFWFKVLKEKQKKAIAKMGHIKKYKKDDTVQNESIRGLLLVIEGCLVSIQNKKQVCLDQQGNYNRLMNILSKDSIEKFTLKAKKPSTVFVIQENVFIEVLGLDYKNEILQAIMADILLTNVFLRQIVSGCQLDINDIMGAFSLKEYKPNQTVFAKGLDNSNKALLIINGEIINAKCDNKTIAKEGEFYNSTFLYQSLEFENDYSAKSTLIALKTSYHELKSVISSKAKNAKYFDIVFNLMNQFEIFQDMPIETIFSISKHIKVTHYEANSFILNTTDKISYLYLLAKGTIKVMASTNKEKKKVKIIEEGNSFCEIFLLNELNCPYQFKAKQDVTIYTLSLNYFFEILTYPKVNNYIRHKMCFEESNILLNDLYYLSYLGRGRFGNVCLVHNEVSFYALKAISKSFSEKQKFGIKYLFSEKKTMNSLDHPFIIKLVKTFKNDNWCFFLQEFISGKNLSEYLELRKSKRNINETRFYSASLFLTISYIHSKRIIHRDIKPANIMINKNGYIKMIDFGTAIKINDNTKTVIGTPNFIAPEVLLGKGYSFPCDYWSIGVCLYYIYYGILPFGNNSLELTDTYKEILEEEVKFPDNSNIELNSLLGSLLNKNEKTRYSNLQTIKNHYVYKDFNWDDLVRFKIKPPYIPGKDPREDEQNLRNLNSLFISFIENEKYDTKQLVTLKAGNVKPISNTMTNNNNNGTGDIPVDWSEGF